MKNTEPMTSPDIFNTEALQTYAAENIPGLMFVTVSGAHLYGFPSPDSDIDLRGTYLAPLEKLISLDKPVETIETKGEVEGREVELVGHEIGKFLRLLIKPNGYVLEQILSPLVIITSDAHQELKELALNSLSRQLYYHYSGFAKGELREYQKPGVGKTVKRLLYLHRVLMTGIVLMTEGVVECNLTELDKRFGLNLAALIEAKVTELAPIEEDKTLYEMNIPALIQQLDEAYAQSSLPEAVPNRAVINDFLIRLRLEKLR